MSTSVSAATVARLRQDFPYYCASLLTIKPKEGGMVPLRLNQTQKFLYEGIPPQLKQTDRRFHWVILERGWRTIRQQRKLLRMMVLKARQEGVSTMCEAWLFWHAVCNPGTNCLVIAQDDQATSDLFMMARLFYNYLPDPLRPAIKISNTRELIFQPPHGVGRGLSSWLKSSTAGWVSVGRGKTIHHLHCSEVSSWNDAETVVDGLFPAVPRDPGSTIIMETTPIGAGSWAHRAWEMAKQGESTFSPVFLPWFIFDGYRAEVPKGIELTKEEKDFAAEYGLDAQQVYWYRLTRNDFELAHPGRGDRYLKAEYPCNDLEGWLVSGHSAFPDTSQDWLYTHTVRDPEIRYEVVSNRLLADKNGRLKVWEAPIAGVQYGVGVDVAGGNGGDASVICVVAHPGYRQVAEWSDKWTDPKALAHVIEPIARHYNEAVVAVEVNGGGLLTNAILWESYSNLYRWEVFDKQRNSETLKLGWDTSLHTKELLVDHANSLLCTHPPGVVVRSAAVVGEMKTFIAEALRGGGTSFYSNVQDDHLLAWLIAIMCVWRKIARYDSYNDTVPAETGEPGRKGNAHEVDLGLPGLFDGSAQRDRDYEDWLSY